MMKKRKLIIVVCILFLLSACKTKELQTGSMKDEMRLAGNKFDYIVGTMKIGNVYAKYNSLSRGETIDVLGTIDDYSYISYHNIELLVKTDLIRLDSEGNYESWKGYAKGNIKCYSDDDFNNVSSSLKMNDEVQIIDEYDGVVVIGNNSKEEYAKLSDFSKKKIVVIKPQPVVETPTYSDDSSSSSSSNEPAPSVNPDPTPTPSVGEDGDSFSLSYKGKTKVVLLDNSIQKAKVLKNNLNTYIKIYNQGEEVKVLSYNDEKVEVLVNGRIGFVDRQYVKLPGDTYDEFEGYSKASTKLYKDFDKTSIEKTLSLNEKIKIVDEVEDMYIVEYNDNSYFVRKTDISKTKIIIQQPVVVPEVVDTTPDYSDSGNSSSSEPEPISEPVWTEPAL